MEESTLIHISTRKGRFEHLHQEKDGREACTLKRKKHGISISNSLAAVNFIHLTRLETEEKLDNDRCMAIGAEEIAKKMKKFTYRD